MGKTSLAFPIGARSIKLYLQRALLLGMAWVSSRLAQFSIERTRSESFSKNDVARIKPISELALTLWVLKRCGIGIPVLERIASWVWQECDHGRVLIRLLLARNDFLPCCTLYASLCRLGFRSDVLHTVIMMIARSDMAKVLPLQPWAHFALRYNLWQLGLSRRPGLAGSGLYVEARPEPWVVSGEIAYAITHEIFYLTDFGFRLFRNECIRSYLRTWIPYWARIFSNERDYDLTGELAMAWTCVGETPSLSNEHPISSVLSRQRRDGSVPGPKNAGSFLRMDGDSSRRREFLRSYHTTLVALMASAMALRDIQRSS
jgi:Domain of unknown function (DUF6895)